MGMFQKIFNWSGLTQQNITTDEVVVPNLPLQDLKVGAFPPAEYHHAGYLSGIKMELHWQPTDTNYVINMTRFSTHDLNYAAALAAMQMLIHLDPQIKQKDALLDEMRKRVAELEIQKRRLVTAEIIIKFLLQDDALTAKFYAEDYDKLYGRV